MKNIDMYVDEKQYKWFQDRHIKFAPWVRNKMFEYIAQSGEIPPIENSRKINKLIKEIGEEIDEKRSNREIFEQKS